MKTTARILAFCLLTICPLLRAQTWTQTSTGGAWSTSAWTPAVPVGSPTASITFLSAGNVVTADFTSTIDAAVTGGATNPFSLQTLTLNGQGDGTSKTLTISGSGSGGLAFTGADNRITFNNPALGNSTDLTYNISAPIQFTNGLTLVGGSTTPVGTGFAFNRITGIISGTGGLTKTGSGRISLNANNTFSGGLTINGTLSIASNQSYGGGTILNAGAVVFSNNTAPFSAGTITIRAGTMGASNTPTLNNNIALEGNVQMVDAPNIAISSLNLNGATFNLSGGTRTILVGGTTASSSLVAIGNTVTISGAVSNGGIVKEGRGTLRLTGTNSYDGGTLIRNGVVQFGTNASIPSTGIVTVNNGGALSVNLTSGNTTVTSWLTSGKLGTGSTGSIALTGNSAETIDFAASGHNTLFLGASAVSTYTGALTPANSTYRLGGGGATLTLSNTNTLTGVGNSLIVGAPIAYQPVGIATTNSLLPVTGSLGTVALTASNNFGGPTTVNSGGFMLTGAGAIPDSDLTVNQATLNSTTLFTPFAITAGTGTTTRAKSVTLNASIMTVAGSAGIDTNDVISGAITAGRGQSTLTFTSTTGQNVQLSADSLVRSPGATLLVRGGNFGVGAIGAADSSNIVLTNEPAFVGSASTSGSSTRILPWGVGDASATGTGTDFLTYDAANGLRRLTSSEYITTFASGNATQSNAKITSAITGINAATTLNSLVLGTGGTIAGTGTITLASGGLLSTGATTSSSAGLAFGANEAMITTVSGSTLTLSGTITGSGGLSKNGSGGLTITGSKAFTGVVRINSGTLSVSTLANGGSNSGVGASSNAATNLILNGGTLTYTGGNVSSDRLFSIGTSGGAITNNGSGTLTLTNNGAMGFNGQGGARTLSLTGSASSSLAAAIGDNGGATTVAKLGGGSWTLTGNNTYTGPTYIVGDANNAAGTISTNFLADGGNASGIGASTNDAANLVINRGTFQYTGPAVNTDRLFSIGATNTASVNASGTGAVNFTNPGAMGFFGSANLRTLVLTGTNTGLNTLAALIRDSGPESSLHSTSLSKTGIGTWRLTGANTYSGATTVSAGTLIAASNGALGSSIVTVTTGGTLSLAGANAITNDITLGLTAGSGGTLSNVGGGNLTLSGNVLNNGTVDSGGQAIIFDGSLSGAGRLTGNGSFTANGTVSPGNSPGTATVDGTTLSLTNSTNTVWQLASLKDNGNGVAGTDWDNFALANAGSLTLDGTLSIALDGILFDGSNAFWQANHSFTLVSGSGSFAGAFDAFSSNVYTDTFGTGTFTYNSLLGQVEYSFAAVPEPSPVAFLCMGIAILFHRRKRNRLQSSF